MDNLTQFKTSVIISNISEVAISEMFVGANTFGDVLNKLVCGYRLMSKEILELRGQILQISDMTKGVSAAITNQTQMLAQCITNSTNSNTAFLPSLSTEATPTFFSTLQQPRRWPDSLQSLGGIRLSTLVCQFVAERLDMIPAQPNNKTQNEVSRAMKIVAKFDQDITRLKTLYGGRKPSSLELNTWRTKSNDIESRVLGHIEQKKLPNSNSKRQKKHSGLVLTILRSWKND